LGIERQLVDNVPFSPKSVGLVRRALDGCVKNHDCSKDKRSPLSAIADTGVSMLLVPRGVVGGYYAQVGEGGMDVSVWEGAAGLELFVGEWV